jgi:FMN hydrolase / 5-amino-6-(5-phospho-D-ribitylamino)uracil phosphatase
MNSTYQPLVSLDIGGTLGEASGPGLAAHLAAISPLGPRNARRIMRDLLHTAPEITDSVIEKVSAALEIPPTAFPASLPVAPLVLYEGVEEALRRLSKHATLVTISNVTCTEVDAERLQDLLGPWVNDHFPSCRTGFAKPDPRAFQGAASCQQLPASALIHVGDDWECDILGAIAVKASAIWISRGRTPPDEALLVTHDVLVAEDFTDAVQHICRLLDARTS